MGQPQPMLICQYAKAQIIPMAPCAQLKMPVVVYVRVSPLAVIA